jgi:hypothetical protein
VAVDGAWTQNVDADHLRRLLSDLLTGESRPRILERMGATLSSVRRTRTERRTEERTEEKTA